MEPRGTCPLTLLSSAVALWPQQASGSSSGPARRFLLRRAVQARGDKTPKDPEGPSCWLETWTQCPRSARSFIRQGHPGAGTRWHSNLTGAVSSISTNGCPWLDPDYSWRAGAAVLRPEAWPVVGARATRRREERPSLQHPPSLGHTLITTVDGQPLGRLMPACHCPFLEHRRDHCSGRGESTRWEIPRLLWKRSPKPPWRKAVHPGTDSCREPGGRREGGTHTCREPGGRAVRGFPLFSEGGQNQGHSGQSPASLPRPRTEPLGRAAGRLGARGLGPASVGGLSLR